jgi:hypothetical protein
MLSSIHERSEGSHPLNSFSTSTCHCSPNTEEIRNGHVGVQLMRALVEDIEVVLSRRARGHDRLLLIFLLA